jgi:hypothetical protein
MIVGRFQDGKIIRAFRRRRGRKIGEKGIADYRLQIADCRLQIAEGFSHREHRDH